MAYEEKEYTKSFEWKTWRKIFPFLKPYKATMWRILIFNLLCAGVRYPAAAFPALRDRQLHREEQHGGPCALCAFLCGRHYLPVDQRHHFYARFDEAGDGPWARHEARLLCAFADTFVFYYNVTPVGYLLARVMSDTNRIAALVAWNFFDILWAVTYVIGVFVAMLLLNVQLALVVMLVVPAIAFLTIYFQNRILHWNRRVRKINSKITSAYNEGIMGAKTSKTLVI